MLSMDIYCAGVNSNQKGGANHNKGYSFVSLFSCELNLECVLIDFAGVYILEGHCKTDKLNEKYIALSTANQMQR